MTDTLSVEFLHVLHGDKRRNFDTSTPEARQKTAEKINALKQEGVALVLERGDKTYYIDSYEANSNSFMVSSPRTLRGKADDTIRKVKAPKLRAAAGKGKATAVPQVAGGCRG